MDIDELKYNLNRVKEIRNEITDLKKENSYYRRTLYEYIELFRHRLIFIDHGERDRFWWPMHVANEALSRLSDKGEEKVNSDFVNSKKKLISIINRYIKEIQAGFIEHANDLRLGRIENI